MFSVRYAVPINHRRASSPYVRRWFGALWLASVALITVYMPGVCLIRSKLRTWHLPDNEPLCQRVSIVPTAVSTVYINCRTGWSWLASEDIKYTLRKRLFVSYHVLAHDCLHWTDRESMSVVSYKNVKRDETINYLLFAHKNCPPSPSK